MYTVESKCEDMDLTLQHLIFENLLHMKYILFRAIMSDDYVGCSYINNCKNLKEKYKIFYNANVNYLIKHKDILILVKDYLLDAKVNEINLFIRA